VPVREFTHLVAWLKANPEKANFGVPATGSLPHFFALMIGEAVGLKPQIIGYRGSGPLATDLLGGQIPVAVDTLETLLPLHEAGKLRILAVGAAARLAEAQEVPTFRESGFPWSPTAGTPFFAPASMPAGQGQGDRPRDPRPRCASRHCRRSSGPTG
jgi:tripartite-type tricarboxylate transporter receptor subunit TctC